MPRPTPWAGLSPHVRFAARPLRSRWRVERRVLRDYLLFHVEQGQGRLLFDDREIPLEPGGWYWVPPGIPHVLEGHAPPKMRVPYVHFDLIDRPAFRSLPMTPGGFLDARHPAVQPDLPAAAGIPLCGRVQPLVYGEARQNLLRLIELFETQPATAPLESAALILLLLANFIDGANGGQFAGQAALRRVETLLNEQPARHLSNRQLAKLTGYHPVHLARLFQKEKGLSPQQYQRRLRINRAKDLLRHSHLSLTAVAEACGFSSLAVFSRTFHRLEGQSPTEYLHGRK